MPFGVWSMGFSVSNLSQTCSIFHKWNSNKSMANVQSMQAQKVGIYVWSAWRIWNASSSTALLTGSDISPSSERSFGWTPNR